MSIAATFRYGKATLCNDDCFSWLKQQCDNSIHAVVTDPPCGLHEYTPAQVTKLREGKGGVWRIPPSFDGTTRSPLPRFTILTDAQLKELYDFFLEWGRAIFPKLTPGANVVVASNPLLSYLISKALSDARLERRDNGNARRRSAEKRRERVPGRLRNAEVAVGAVGALSQTAGARNSD